LLPALAGGVLPGSERWRRVLLRPGAHPMSELRRVLVSGTADPVAEALDTLGPGERLLLAVDQLEELFTACSDEAERGAFVETLTRAAVDPDRRAIVVVAARADFYGRCAEYPALASLLGANNVLVVPMQPSELRRAIEVPAARVGLKVEPELTDALVDDVDGEPGALPLLSTSLLELWQKRAGDTLTLAAYRESGGVHGAVARLAETTYARIPDPHRPLVRSLMLRLVGEGEGDAAVRRRAPLAELDLERNEDAARVLATLADSRLVTVSEGSVEVAHEALLREWPRLREWIEEDSQGRRLRRHITQAATEWDTAGKDQGELYRGARLAAALDWSTDHAFELNELERAFVTESREASEKETKHVRRTNRRLRGLLIGAAVLLAAAVIGGVFALVQRGNAREAAGEAEQAADEASTSAAQARAAEGEARAAEARAEEEADRAIAAETVQLAQRLGAQALVEQDLGLSLLLARQAVEIHDSPQTRGYLLADLLRSPAAIGTIHGNYVLRDIALSPDGRTLAVPDIAGLLQFDAQTLEQIGEREYPVNLDTEGVAFSPDGATLALGGDGFIRLVDAHTHEQLAEARIDAGASQIVFSSDGSQLAVVHTRPGAGPDWVTIRDAATLRRIGAPIRPEGFRGWWISQWWTVPSIALTPDGRSLVTASAAGELAWWDLASHEKTRALEIPDGYRALALSPDGETAAIGLDDGIELIHVRTGAVRQSAGSLASNPIRLSFSPDGRTLVSTSTDGTVTLWDAGTATVRETLRGHSAAVQQPAFSRDGKTLYTTSLDGTVIAWDLKGDRRLGRTFTFGRDPGLGPYPDRHPGAFSPDGQVIAVGLKGEGVALWDASDLTQIGPPLLQTGGEVDVLAFSPDGQTLAAVANDGGLCFNQPDPPDPCSVATIWDVESRSLRLGPFPIDPWSTRGVSFSADGTMLATAAFEGVRLWDVATGAELAHIGSRRSAGGVVFSPTEPDVLAFITDGWDGSNVREWGGEAEIWDVARRSRIWTLKPDKPEAGGYLGWAIAFSPDGRLLATGGEDPFVHLWDVRTGKLIRDFEKNVKTALALDFTPDGKTLAMSGGEPYVSLWDVATGAEIGTRLTAGAREALLDLSPYGRQLLMTLSNGEGAVWDIDPESWKQRACELANRTLTPEEWEEFLPGRPYEPACAD
jgi:WD40 repeat protein